MASCNNGSQISYFHFNLPKNVDKNLKHETGQIIKHDEFLAEQRIRNDIDQLLF